MKCAENVFMKENCITTSPIDNIVFIDEVKKRRDKLAYH
jgi:hypothetical protein